MDTLLLHFGKGSYCLGYNLSSFLTGNRSVVFMDTVLLHFGKGSYCLGYNLASFLTGKGSCPWIKSCFLFNW